MRLGARVALPFLLGALACYSADGDGDDEEGSSGSGGTTSGGKGGGTSSAGTSSGGKGGGTSSGGSSQGGSTSAGQGGTTAGQGGKMSGGSGGTRECEEVACLRPYECVLECGGEILYSGCCPCEAPTFDGFFECQAAAGAGG